MNQDHERQPGGSEPAPERRLPASIVTFGLRTAALAGFVTPVAMVLSGLAGEVPQQVAAPPFTTCCPW